MNIKIVRILIVVFVSIFLYACTSINNSSFINEKEEVLVKVLLDKNSVYFKNSPLLLKLYEYDPLIADISATLIDLKRLTINFTEEDSTAFPIEYLISKSRFKKDRKYYISARVYDVNKKQTHYGYENGTEGFIKVSKDSNKIVIILK